MNSGDKFQSLTFIEYAASKSFPSGGKKKVAKCICDCGNIVFCIASVLKKGKPKSCGCLKNKYGHKLGLPRKEYKDLFSVFKNMVTRCYDPKSMYYKRYGGRGIIICDEWKNDFPAFFTWASQNGYKRGLQLDRIDNTQGYSPDNCRFVTGKQNCRNKHNNNLVTIDGVTKTVTEWAEIKKFDRRRLCDRVLHGWPTNKLFSPIRQQHFYSINFMGKDIKMRELAKLTGIPSEALRDRILNGWDADKIVRTPTINTKTDVFDKWISQIGGSAFHVYTPDINSHSLRTQHMGNGGYSD